MDATIYHVCVAIIGVMLVKDLILTAIVQI